eukprot:843468-Amphidinium_carterae.2
MGGAGLHIPSRPFSSALPRASQASFIATPSGAQLHKESLCRSDTLEDRELLSIQDQRAIHSWLSSCVKGLREDKSHPSL